MLFIDTYLLKFRRKQVLVQMKNSYLSFDLKIPEYFKFFINLLIDKNDENYNYGMYVKER